MRAAFANGRLAADAAPGETERSEGPIRLILAGRLHYRPAGEVDPAAGALAAYREHGLDGLAPLEGEFALILIDDRARRLLALRDAMGAWPLFWRPDPNGWSLASTLAALPRAADAALDLDYLAERLILGRTSAEGSEATPFLGPRRLQPGEIAVFGFHRGAPALHPTLDWNRRIDGETLGTQAGAGEDYRRRLEAAVGERARGATAAHVSGGVDSSAVALLAARNEGRVDGLAMVFDAPEALRREHDFIDLASHDRLRVRRLSGDQLLDFAWDTILPHAEPTPWLFRAGQDRALIDAAAQAGAATILTGEGADEILAMPPLEILDLARRLKLRRARREASRWALATGTTLGDVIARLAAGRLPFPARPEPPPWINPDFARSSGWRDKARRAASSGRDRHDSHVRAHLLAQIAAMRGDWANEALAHPRGIHISHPFRDPRVIAFGAAARLRFGADPSPKALLVAAMRGIVPDPILDRRSKASFAPLTYIGLQRHRGRLAEMIARAPPEVDALFLRERLCEAIDTAALGMTGMAELHALAGALGIVRWIELLPAWRASVRGSAG